MEDFPEIPGYKIVSELGSGAVAIVYLGIQEKLERKVAIKVMEETTLQKDKQISKRFVREAKTAANLSHSNIIQIYDAGKVGRYYYIVMEYLEESLRDRQMRSPRYKIVPDMAVDIVGDIMRALDYAQAIPAGRPFENLGDLVDKIPAFQTYTNTGGFNVGDSNIDDDLEERDWILSRLSTVFTTRSDVFTAYILVRIGQDGPQRRVMAIFDRSGVWTPEDRPEVLALKTISDPR